MMMISYDQLKTQVFLKMDAADFGRENSISPRTKTDARQHVAGSGRRTPPARLVKTGRCSLER